MRSGTAEGLVAFLQWTQEKGLLPAATAAARRSAVQKVLEIDGDEWQAVDVATLDTEHQFERFARLRGSKYSPGSLATYGQRFRDAVALYLEYLANPTGFRPPKGRATGGKKATADNKSTPNSPAQQSAKPAASSTDRIASRDLITYPFPLQDGQLAYLQLPITLTASDAERLAGFIRSITRTTD